MMSLKKQGYIQDIVSPNGGKTPIEPKSLVPLVADKSVKRPRKRSSFYYAAGKILLSLPDINWQDYDVIYYTGGHGVMWDFLDNPELQEITKNIYEKGGIVSSVCHGYCGLLNVRLSNGERLIKGKS
ncbi:DJ-1/PfpI family protein [Acinetobacter baumannii]